MNQEDKNSIIIKKKRSFRDYSRSELLRSGIQMIGLLSIFFSVLYFFGIISLEINLFDSKSDQVSSGILENKPKQEETPSSSFALSRAIPDAIRIPKVNIDTSIEHPESQEIQILNNALEYGAVYYPESGDIAAGNIFLFGHSSNWKIVQNKAYKTFNGIEKLIPGDKIILEADGREYVYEVATVSLVNDDEALVEIGGDERKLTLSTCNSFGEKQERWVVEAYPENE